MAVTSTGLIGRTGVIIQLVQKKLIDLNTTLDDLKINTGINWSWGALANQADLLWHDKLEAIPVSTGTITSLIDGASIKDAFGDFAQFSAVKMLYVKNLSTTINLELFGHATTGILIPKVTTDVVIIKPLGFFLWADPSAAGLVLSSNGSLQMCSVSDTVDAEVAVLGLKSA